MGLLKESRGSDPLIMGAVAYDQKVVTIWDGFQQYFRSRGLEFDYVLYSNYERQVEAHLRGHVHVAWNSPLAWLQAERRRHGLGRRAEAICMRDTDRDLTIHRPGAIRRRRSRPSPTSKGEIVAVGASDSPQATLIPLNYLAEQGLEPDEDFQVKVFDVLAGKHGDHIGGERDAVRALLRGDADAACILDANHLAFAREGTIPRRRRENSRPDARLRSLQLHGSRRRAGGAGRTLPGSALGHVVWRCRGSPAARSRRAEAMGARTRQRLRAARRGRRSIRHDRALREHVAGSMQVDLDTLGFAEGGYLLVKRALRQAAPGEDGRRHRHRSRPGGRSARLVPRGRPSFRVAAGNAGEWRTRRHSRRRRRIAALG